MSKGKTIADKALQPIKKQRSSPDVKKPSAKPRSAKEGERQPTLIHWFLENPVEEETEEQEEQAPVVETADEIPPTTELEAHITQLQAEKQELTEYRSSVLLNKERENKQLKRVISDLETQVLRLNRLLDQKDQEIEALTTHLKERDVFMSALQRTGLFRRAFRWQKCFGQR